MTAAAAAEEKEEEEKEDFEIIYFLDHSNSENHIYFLNRRNPFQKMKALLQTLTRARRRQSQNYRFCQGFC